MPKITEIPVNEPSAAAQRRKVDPSGSLQPWTPLRTSTMRALSAQLDYDRAAVWLLQPDRPSPDELLAQHGLTPELVRDWCETENLKAPLIQDALVAGRAVGVWQEAGFHEADGRSMHAIVHALPESHPQQRWWLAVLARASRPYTEAERQSLDIVLRQLQTSLNQPERQGAARGLAGHDDRPISTDLAFHQTTARLGMPVRELLRRIRDIRDQRWETIADDETHDLVMEAGDKPFWVVFRRTRAIDLAVAAQWFIELRPVDQCAPPPVGVVEDERVARAIAYLHDHFAENPSLEQMAAHVHVSPYHFHRVFTRLVGESPKRYLQLKQMQVACSLLRSTHTPVRDIAELTGFTSHGHFNATFRRLMNLSPSQFRAKAQ